VANEIEPLDRTRRVVEPSRAKLPASCDVLRQPLVEVMPALQIARQIDSFTCAVEDWRASLRIFPRIHEAGGALSAALWPPRGSQWRDAEARRQIAGAIIAIMFRSFGMRASDDPEGLIDGALATLLDGDEVAEAMGQEPINATPAVLAIAAQQLIRSAKYPPRPSEVAAACREARSMMRNRKAILDTWIDSLRKTDWKVLESDAERWRAAYPSATVRRLMLDEHFEHLECSDLLSADERERAVAFLEREWELVADDSDEGHADA
jgi:hypothetical protein